MREFQCLSCDEVITVMVMGHSDRQPTDKEAAEILFVHCEEHAPDAGCDTADVLREFEEVTHA